MGAGDHLKRITHWERSLSRTLRPQSALRLGSDRGTAVCHVLIIEYEPFVAMILQDILEDEGATSVVIAATEEDAVASALARPPALITSDVRLLEGTGPRAVQTIQEKLGAVPVIFITATPDDCRPCNPPGIILRKPVDQRALASAFHKLAHV